MIGQTAAFSALAVLAGIGTIAALALWPASDPERVAHRHDDLPADHPHLRENHQGGAHHAFVIDDLHEAWPRAA